MLGQEERSPLGETVSGTDEDLLIANCAATIFEWEHLIDDDKRLYMFTWSPNPEFLPDSDIRIQHEWCIMFIADFLKSVVGIACVEFSENAYPHYHGWYQKGTELEFLKARCVKLLRHYGNWKVTLEKGHHRINSYTKRGNSLHYYKKELTCHLLLQNPVTKTTETTINWQAYQYLNFFDKKGVFPDMDNKLSNIEYWRRFYEDSTY